MDVLLSKQMQHSQPTYITQKVAQISKRYIFFFWMPSLFICNFSRYFTTQKVEPMFEEITHHYT